MGSGLGVLLLLLVCLWLLHEQNRRQELFRIRNRRKGRKNGAADMNETVRQFIGKECIITVGISTVAGVIEQLEDHRLVLTATGTNERSVLNMEYISRIREYPRKKNGKKKAVVFWG
jgi:hypothetical protein